MKVLALVVAAFALFALVPAGMAQSESGLAGTQWQLVSLGGTPAADGVISTIQFGADGRFGGRGGCNTYGGSYTINGDTLSFSRVISTMMACANGMEQEQALFAAFETAGRYETDGDRLVIAYDGGEMVFMRIGKLPGTSWQLVSLGGTPVIEGSTLTLEFSTEDRISGNSGCNVFGGSYSVDGGSLTLSEVFATLRACLDEALGAQEQAYLGALGSVTGYEIVGSELHIRYGNDLLLVFARVPTLTNTAWNLVSYGDGTAVIDGSEITLQFDAENRAAGSSGCNRYNSSATISGSAISFAPVASTRRACLSAELSAQEQAFFSALAAAASYELSDDQLIIHYGEGQQLVFARA